VLPKTSLSKTNIKHVWLRHVPLKKFSLSSKSSGGAPGKHARARMHSRAFPRINSTGNISQGLSPLVRTLDR